ncbi:MAG: phosphatidate cytidylyltransferase [Chlorobi bacterium]|nr:phosphatidate cytidylyltransferase [Chlorobiota bacterium]
MKNLIIRSITGLFFVFIIVVSILFSNISFFVLFALIILFGMWEFYSLVQKAEIKPQKFVAIIIGLLLFTANYLFAKKIVDEAVFLIFIPFVFFIFIFEIYKNEKKPFVNIAVSILGIIYIALPFSLFNYFVFHGNYITDVFYNPNILLSLFILMWVHDTGSYLFGVTLGKHRLFERLSPKKSWEGFIGGSLLTLFTGYKLAYFFPQLDTRNWVIFALIVIIAGTFGDLSESQFKRSISIKDSGKILPGHGGILDRFDGILLASPMVFIYLQFIN